MKPVRSWEIRVVSVSGYSTSTHVWKVMTDSADRAVDLWYLNNDTWDQLPVAIRRGEEGAWRSLCSANQARALGLGLTVTV